MDIRLNEGILTFCQNVKKCIYVVLMYLCSFPCMCKQSTLTKYVLIWFVCVDTLLVEKNLPIIENNETVYVLSMFIIQFLKCILFSISIYVHYLVSAEKTLH